MVILCFERRFFQQNSVIRVKPNILPPQFLGWLRHCPLIYKGFDKTLFGFE